MATKEDVRQSFKDGIEKERTRIREEIARRVNKLKELGVENCAGALKSLHDWIGLAEWR